jgi:Zn-dependent protease with chaperone function
LFEGKLYDGTTGYAYDVRVSVAGDSLEIEREGWSDRVSFELLRRIEAAQAAMKLSRSDIVGWRLILPGDAATELDPLLGQQERYGRWVDRVGLIPALIVAGALTASVIAIGYVAPHWLAPQVPMSWERNVGSTIVGDFGTYRCRSAKGQQALEALVERVAPRSTKGPDAIKVSALDVPMFNAAALPGGYIVVFKPAITETDPEALAGILAHEVAHVRRRHVTEALIRELGIGSLIRLFAGNLGANAEQLVGLSYTRANEAQADSDAIVMLSRARISPRPTAALFDRLAREQEEGLVTSAQFLQSHPRSRDRARRFAASFDSKTQYGPALNRDQADALFDICSKRRPQS